MSQINNISSSPTVQKIVTNPIRKEIPAAPTAAPVRASDRLELSGAGHLLAAAKNGDIRTDKVSEIRQQIHDGSYDADGKKLDGAIDKLIDDLD